ncbi:hypothetical protein [Scytonema sp. HK-05]|uniref:hypothetical protein n=1 Tax=Scytonema sp. HK-05 TaxID=1137095 RepID=UPI0011611DAC|nr:hypothetical protein [Scytonema sp. HK-05]
MSSRLVRWHGVPAFAAIASGETPCQYQRSLLEKSLVNTSDRILTFLFLQKCIFCPSGYEQQGKC